MLLLLLVIGYWVLELGIVANIQDQIAGSRLSSFKYKTIQFYHVMFNFENKVQSILKHEHRVDCVAYRLH